MISSAPNLRRANGAFTFVELMIAASIGSFVLIGVLSSFLMLVRSGVRVSNYSTMESQTRRAFEQLGIDSRMANNFVSHFSGGVITSFTLTIPSNDLTSQREVTYGYDTSNSSNKKLFMVPGSDPSTTTGRIDLVTYVATLTFLRYDSTGTLIPVATTSDSGIKHIQISVSVSRGNTGSSTAIVAATQVIRSSAFTLRNISL